MSSEAQDKARPQASAYIDDLIASIAEGGEVKADIFETLKKVARSTSPAVQVVAPAAGHTPRAATPVVRETVKFECPVCGIAVDEDATACPGCGAKFAEEANEDLECPVCGASIVPSATSCSSCGVQFAGEADTAAKRTLVSGSTSPLKSPPSSLRERLAIVRTSRSQASAPAPPKDRRALYKELPFLVNEVKPMLLSAKELGVDIEEPKRLINDAIAAGKRREIEQAVRLVAGAKHRLENAFAIHSANGIETLLVEVERAKNSRSGDVRGVEQLLESSVGHLENGNFASAFTELSKARDEFDKHAGGYHRAKEALLAAESLVENSRAFGIPAGPAEALIRQGREALGRREYDRAAELGDKARTTLMGVLPDVLGTALKNARNRLLDLKLRGGDLTRAIGLLKQASIHLKREEYGDAMRFVRAFRQETGAV